MPRLQIGSAEHLARLGNFAAPIRTSQKLSYSIQDVPPCWRQQATVTGYRELIGSLKSIDHDPDVVVGNDGIRQTIELALTPPVAVDVDVAQSQYTAQRRTETRRLNAAHILGSLGCLLVREFPVALVG